MRTIWKANVKMFCDPHTPPYHALSMPLDEAPFTKKATSAATMTVRMTANRYGSGIRRSTYRTHSAVRDCMTPPCFGRVGFGCSGSASGAPLVAWLVAFGSSLVVIDLPSLAACRCQWAPGGHFAWRGLPARPTRLPAWAVAAAVGELTRPACSVDP